MSELDSEWLEALGVEDTSADDTSADDDTSKDDDTSADDTSADDTSNEDGKKEEGDDNSDSDSGDGTGDDTSDEGGAKDEDEKSKDQEEPDEKATTKEAIKEALAEIEASKTDRSAQFDLLKGEVSKTLYPEGLNRQLRDADGDPITGIDDLTKLVNPRTGELFTDEEAGAWLLQAQQKLNQDIEKVERFIEEVADVNMNVTEGAKRVAEKYKDILSADPKLRDRLLEGYNRTLVKDPDTGITLRAPVDVEEFFDIALGPRIEAAASQAEAEAQAAKLKAEQDAKNAQQDRGDLKPNGKSDNLDPEDKEWAQAIKNYEEGVRP